LTSGEAVNANSLTSFNSNGFSVGSEQRNNNNVSSYVGWQWNAGGTTVTNTSGSISSQVRANPTAGFSVVTYTGNGTGGATIGHGLGVAPRMIILKRRNGTSNWTVGHSSLPSWANFLVLNITDGQGSNNVVWNSTAPTSSVFTVGTGADQNGSGNTIVAYCFAPVAGYSAFGSYTGNGSADGTFIYTGFRPAYVLRKRTDSTSDWVIADDARNPSNEVTSRLYANVNDAEGGEALDFLSNGFKNKADGSLNTSGGTYIYMAFAETPFNYANAR
jgi:hypothetical protein